MRSTDNFRKGALAGSRNCGLRWLVLPTPTLGPRLTAVPDRRSLVCGTPTTSPTLPVDMMGKPPPLVPVSTPADVPTADRCDSSEASSWRPGGWMGWYLLCESEAMVMDMGSSGGWTTLVLNWPGNSRPEGAAEVPGPAMATPPCVATAGLIVLSTGKKSE